MLGEVSAIPPHPVIVCSAVKREYEQRPGRNITLFKGFFCSAECRLLMSHQPNSFPDVCSLLCLSVGWEPKLEALQLSTESEHLAAWRKNAEMACIIIHPNMIYSYMHKAQNRFLDISQLSALSVNRLMVEYIKSFSVLCSAKLQRTCVTMFCEVIAVFSCTGLSL